MSGFITAQNLSKKVGAFKHLTKKINEINKNGQAIIRLNNTGVELIAKKGDALYLKLATAHAQLAEDINSYEIVQRANGTSPATETN